MPTRRSAATAIDDRCPRCGIAREPGQSYCVECGLRLPVVTGTVAALRRRWVGALGWYPGDFVWLALASLIVAAAGAAGAIELGRAHGATSAATYVAPPLPAVRPVLASGPDGRTVWPPRLDAWTVVLLSSPAASGRRAPLAFAAGAARDGLPQVGVLDSSSFASLHPGYLVVFSGVYGAPVDANLALATVRARGFGQAYVLRVAP
jgi:hypothetical protein